MQNIDAGVRRKQTRILGMSTFAFTVCFAVWAIFSIIGLRIKQELGSAQSLSRSLERSLLASTGVFHQQP